MVPNVGDTVTLQENFETRIQTVMKNGQPVLGAEGKPLTETVPKYLKGKNFPVVEMNFFWMDEKEKGGVGVLLSTMDYVRLTFPDGTKTKYFDLFPLKAGNP